MSKLKVIYIVSLIILAVLIAFTVFRPMSTSGKYSEVQKVQLLEAEGEWAIELAILNHEDSDQNYTINILVDDELITDSISIKGNRMSNYNYSISRDMITRGEVSLAVYKEGQATPFEQITYYLK